ncbi:MAG: hypothetical protein XE11_1868 [Methanomicrobiales archaeon 53_19]|nr:MAG: hypothetical protein XE11_1868 [Methanomicrobiales archaeon 53_19]
MAGRKGYRKTLDRKRTLAMPFGPAPPVLVTVSPEEGTTVLNDSLSASKRILVNRSEIDLFSRQHHFITTFMSLLANRVI